MTHSTNLETNSEMNLVTGAPRIPVRGGNGKAVNRKYLNTATRKITNLPLGVASGDAVNKKQMEDAISTMADAVSTSVETRLADAISAHLVAASHAEAGFANPASADLNMATRKITDLSLGVASGDAVNKKQMEDAILSRNKRLLFDNVLVVVLGRVIPPTDIGRKLRTRPAIAGHRCTLTGEVGKTRPLEWSDLPIDLNATDPSVDL